MNKMFGRSCYLNKIVIISHVKIEIIIKIMIIGSLFIMLCLFLKTVYKLLIKCVVTISVDY